MYRHRALTRKAHKKTSRYQNGGLEEHQLGEQSLLSLQSKTLETDEQQEKDLLLAQLSVIEAHLGEPLQEDIPSHHVDGKVAEKVT